MDFSHEAAQHKVIHDNLDRIIAFIRDAKADHSKFKSEELKELMENFREPLVRILNGYHLVFKFHYHL